MQKKIKSEKKPGKPGKSDYTPIREHEVFTENPFIDMLSGESKIFKKKTFIQSTPNDAKIIVSEQTGEQEGTLERAFVKHQTIEKNQFVKVYIDKLKDWFALSKQGMRVLMYIIKNVRMNEMHVIFEMKEALMETEYKDEKSVLQGIDNLIRAGFIARSDKHYKYFTNPMLFFNGANRMTFADSYSITNENGTVQTIVKAGTTNANMMQIQERMRETEMADLSNRQRIQDNGEEV